MQNGKVRVRRWIVVLSYVFTAISVNLRRIHLKNDKNDFTIRNAIYYFQHILQNFAKISPYLLILFTNVYLFEQTVSFSSANTTECPRKNVMLSFIEIVKSLALDCPLITYIIDYQLFKPVSTDLKKTTP